MKDPFEQMAHVGQYRRKLALRMTPQERMRQMARLQEQAWAALRANPQAMAHFLRRNYKARAIDVRELHARGK